MIKKLLLPLLFFELYFCRAQGFQAKFNFASVSGSCTSNCKIDPTPLPVVPGLDFVPFSAVGTGSAPNASGRFSFQGWPTGASNGIDTYTAYTGSLSLGAYYEVSLIVQAGYTLNLSGISFSVRRSGTGIRNYAVRSSRDGYATNLPAGVGGSGALSIVGNNIFFWNSDAASTSADQTGSRIIPDSTLSGLQDTVSFRFYAWNSENGSLGTFSIDSVVFIGSASNSPPVTTGINVPQPINGFKVFPNPSHSGRISIKSDHPLLNLEVFSQAGELVFQLRPDPAENSSEIDLSHLQAGVYYLKAQVPDRIVYRHLVISK